MPGFDQQSRLQAQQRQNQQRQEQIRRTSAAAADRGRAQFKAFVDQGRKRELDRQATARRLRFDEQQRRLRFRPPTTRNGAAPPRAGPSIAPTATPAATMAIEAPIRRLPLLVPIAIVAILIGAGGFVAWRAVAPGSARQSTIDELTEMRDEAIEVNRRWDEQTAEPSSSDQARQLFAETRLGLEAVSSSASDIRHRATVDLQDEVDGENLTVVDQGLAVVERTSRRMLDGLLGPAGETSVRQQALADFQQAVDDVVDAIEASGFGTTGE